MNLKGMLRKLCFGLMSARSLHRHLMFPESNSYKIGLLRHFGASVGKGVRIYHPVTLININGHKDLSNLRVGNNVYIGHNVSLDLKDIIDIGSNVTISMNVTVVTHTDVGNIPLSGSYPPASGRVMIKDNVFIGTGTTILKGVTIGPNSVVAAGAVVNRDVEPYTVVGGVPAVTLKKLEIG